MGYISNLKPVFFGGVFLAMAAPGASIADERVGLLECRLSGNGVTVLVENQSVDCVYRGATEGSPPQHYIGKLTKVGANLSFNGPGEFVWGVLAATRILGPGALAGRYAGPEATVKVGVGGGGAILVGGSNNTISLQPFNVESGMGLGWTAGVESLDLAFAPDQPPPPMKHQSLLGPIGYLTEAVVDSEEAIEQGRQGRAEVLVTHAEAALKEADASQSLRKNKHTKEAVAQLAAAIVKGKKGQAENATKHAEAALTHFHMALAEEHLLDAIGDTKEAIKRGKMGHADGLATHAEAALEHARASATERANPDTTEGVRHLKEAVEHGKMGYAEEATNHAEAALRHLEQAQ